MFLQRKSQKCLSAHLLDFFFSSLEGMTSALKTDMQQVSAPHLCKKPMLVVQLNQIQPRPEQ